MLTFDAAQHACAIGRINEGKYRTKVDGAAVAARPFWLRQIMPLG
jgi:hypothetical protein